MRDSVAERLEFIAVECLVLIRRNGRSGSIATIRHREAAAGHGPPVNRAARISSKPLFQATEELVRSGGARWKSSASQPHPRNMLQ